MLLLVAKVISGVEVYSGTRLKVGVPHPPGTFVVTVWLNVTVSLV